MMGLMSVCVVKRWHLAQELMSFDHLGPVSIVGPLDHSTTIIPPREPKKCACARTYTRKKTCFICPCASASALVSMRSTCVCSCVICGPSEGAAVEALCVVRL